ncbi:hypothetical protein IB265_34675 [Ensifer sp. ENS10]|uniref:hypothetical protein n=1 Tax=Ensifer sp. ENS10 TaxID=2769286 RepID=UPI00178061E4|nr:hypothetical protein [Ensifer sp. ENS10]MBD9511896.1 hypothetical protein [Ensifer sp. ENS10]
MTPTNILLNHLGFNGRWHTASEIFEQTGISPVEVRQIAGDNGSKIIGGPKGYRLVTAATRHEIEAACRSLRSRAAKINERAALLETTLA